MLRINIPAIPAQRFQVLLDGQYCNIRLRQKGNRIYCDLDLADTPVFAGAVCVHGARINQSPSHLFRGTLYFYDLLGQDAPHWRDIGGRYVLLYLAEEEAGGAA
jgi:hypothetical protein